jgi:hypothetical protein
VTALADMKSGKYGDRTYTRPCVELPVPAPGERGGQPHAREDFGDIVLRAYAAKTPGRIAAGLSGSRPGRIAGGLPWTDRPVRSVESSSPYRTDRRASFPAIRPR